MNHVLKKSIESTRKELLDIGLRGNTLLHFKHSAKTIPIVDELSAEIFKLLVTDSKSMSFLPVPSALNESDEVDPLGALPKVWSESVATNRHTDLKLQTSLKGEALDKRLVRVENEAKTFFEEQGIDILHVALGFLEWYESDVSEQKRLAPLVLIPVELRRSTAREKFNVRYTEADLGTNLSLQAKLKSDFQLSLPEFSDDVEISDYLANIHKLVSKQLRWKVHLNQIAVGFFSFGKFQMYQDMDLDKWPEEALVYENPILSSLLGDGFESRDGLGEVTALSDFSAVSDRQERSVYDLHHVMDSDSSQSSAVRAVKDGGCLVIQGPPGTGKSQTITNIIAEAIADNKTILFVSEKMAALEVVARRLETSQLGSALLELHSHKSNKKAVYESLRATLELGEPELVDRSRRLVEHQERKDYLNQYAQTINTPILSSGVSYNQAVGRLLCLPPSPEELEKPLVCFPELSSDTGADFHEKLAAINAIIEFIEKIGPPRESKFRWLGKQALSPLEERTLLADSKQLVDAMIKLQKRLQQVASKLPLTVDSRISQGLKIADYLSWILDAPATIGVDLTLNTWLENARRVDQVLEEITIAQGIRADYDATLIDQAWDTDLLACRSALNTIGVKWWRLLSGEYRSARRKLRGLIKTGQLPSIDECINLVDQIMEFQAIKRRVAENALTLESLYGSLWQGVTSSLAQLSNTRAWITRAVDVFDDRSIAQDVLSKIGVSDLPLVEAQEIERTVSEIALFEAKINEFSMSIEAIPGWYREVTWDEIITTLSMWPEDIEGLYRHTQLKRMLASLTSLKLDAFSQIFEVYSGDFSDISAHFERVWFEGLVEEAFRTSDILKHFDVTIHNRMREEFRQLDHELFSVAQERLSKQLYERLPSTSGGGGQLGLLRREMNKKRRQLSIRKLIDQAAKVIQDIKPIFMMSPMSVATYLPPGKISFDLVIFDEASQVKVADALPPLLRGRQAVVVGDTKQMPPTDFFGKALELDDEEAEGSVTADIESVLSLFLAQGAPESMLRWHYRSRHDSLITVSNQEFYDNKLMIFPSPGANPNATGLSFRHLPETSYDRGGSRANLGEAQALAREVAHHAKTCPELTLGIVAFSTAQRDAILFEVERIRREEPEIESFFSKHDDEHFFVKNLENVQGDERDIILISIGYGRTQAGNMASSFGPLNREGGERRLNVLITRARMAMVVFCNFTADELKITGKTPFGVRSLHAFLKYAETGVLENKRATGRDTDSPFEDEVISAIESLGYEVEPQVGSSGFFIDIAVRDPIKPGRFILAVECDGATYHSSATARDRDRIRQNVLEGLGWRFHRIWSTDWFRDPKRQTELLKGAIEKSVAFYQALDSGKPQLHSPPTQASIPTAKVVRRERVEDDSGVEYRRSDASLGIMSAEDLLEIDESQLRAIILNILEVEAPIHIKELAKRIANGCGVSRVGRRLLDRFSDTVRRLVYDELNRVTDDFIYSSTAEVTLRRRSGELNKSQRNIELVSPEEIALAITETIKLSYRIKYDDIAKLALDQIGFGTASAKSVRGINSVLDSLLAKGEVIDAGDGLLELRE
ncbi:MAG: DUF3320 domain-containing protein [Pseudomonadales bacterium]